MNATTAYKSQPSMYPFYYSAQPTLIDGLSDHHLSLIAPILAYWGLSLFFHILDISDWKWLDKYRIHESAEVKKRNLVSRRDVIIAVLFQQVVQTFLGLITLPSDDEQAVNHFERIQIYGNYSRPLFGFLLGKHATPLLLQNVGYWVYWWGIPAAQFVAAMFVIDTWQYFLHRAMHINKWMYRHFHSWHHRLYVPYAFGALYNHPIEGLALDTLSALVAQLATGMNARQAALFFAFSTFKTIDDHCGYSLPFDPLQLMSGNNADYHDIHHQVIGIKSNFAQPFFVHWDTILGTRMTRAEMNARRKKNSAKIE